HFEHASLAQCAHPAHDVIRRRHVLAGLEEQDCARKVAETRHPVSDGDLVDDLDTATPGSTRDGPFWPRPPPGVGSFAITELDQRARILPRSPEVFRLPRLGELEGVSIEQSRAKRLHMDVIEVRTRAEVHLGGPTVEARNAEVPEKVVQVRVVAVAEKW